MKTTDKVLIEFTGPGRPDWVYKYFDLNISQKKSDCFYQAINVYSQVNRSFELGLHVDNNIEFSKI